jgi:SAM-dependent methyltransferase
MVSSNTIVRRLSEPSRQPGIMLAQICHAGMLFFARCLAELRFNLLLLHGDLNRMKPTGSDFFPVMQAEGLYSTAKNLKFFTKQLFRKFDFSGKRVLDIGGGTGLITFFAASRGALEAICLEPEDAGSASGVRSQFEKVRATHDWGSVAIQNATFQEFVTGDPGSFDLLVSCASINHLDELACEELLKRDSARASYLAIGKQMHDLLKPGGTLLITDCSRRNLWADLGLRNPIDPGIEWTKHQTPGTWIQLLEECGLTLVRKEYKSFNSLGLFGKAILGNSFASYCLTSNFILEFQRRDSTNQ